MRLLIAGLGLVGARHAEAARNHPKIELAATVDPTLEGIENTPHFPSVAAVNIPVDAALIATPTGTHAALGAEAAARGWAVLVEKPIAASITEGKALIAACEAAGVPLLVGHHRRQHAFIQTAREGIASGAVGTPVGVSAIWSVRKPAPYFKTAWRGDANGSPVMINLVHDIDLLQYLLGEIREITPLLSGATRKGATEDTAAIALSFASGALGTILMSDSAPSPWSFEAASGENPNIAAGGRDSYRIIGTEGALGLPSLTLWGGAKDWSERLQTRPLTAPRTDPLAAQLDHFHDVVANGAAPVCSGADGLSALAVAEAVREGKPWKRMAEI
ncbi:MAG: Gfo/Idh/MocA family oxidoreductase [Pseudomonadota bacterium]